MRREVKIGIFLAVAIFLLATFIFVVGDLSVLFKKQGFPLYILYDSAAGLEKGALVRMAGVKIGYVKEISLKGSKAEVLLNIEPGIKVPQGSKATLASLGLLGEKHIEILPGEGEDFCRPGATIEGIPPVSFDQMGTLLLSVGNEFKEIGKTFSQMLGGEESRVNFKLTLQNLSSITSDLKEFLGANKEELHQGLRRPSQAIQKFEQRVEEVSKNLDELISLLKNVVEENRESVRINLERIRELITKTEESLRLLNESLEKINRGEGTLGKLVQQPELYERAEETMDELERIIRPVSKLKLSAGLRAEYYSQKGSLKNYFIFDLWSSKKRHLLAQAIHDPWLDRFVYSVQGGIRWGDFSPRAGIMESKLGAGLDYYAAKDRIIFSVESYDFKRSPRPHFRIWTKYAASKYFSLVLGADDFTLVPDRKIFFGFELGFK